MAIDVKDGTKFKELLKGEMHDVRFYLWLKDGETPTQVSQFFDSKISEIERKKIIAILGFVDMRFPCYAHPLKFKFLVDRLYEIKNKQIRIACFWYSSKELIAIYGFKKKGDEWPAQELVNAKRLYRKITS